MTTEDEINKAFYDLGTTQNAEGNMFDVKLRREYLQDQWRNRKDNPYLYYRSPRYLRCLDGSCKRIEDDFRLALLIYEYNLRGEPINFTRMMEETGWGLPKMNRLSEKLVDYTVVDRRWENVNGTWMHCWYISEEMGGFIKGLWNTSFEGTGWK